MWGSLTFTSCKCWSRQHGIKSRTKYWRCAGVICPSTSRTTYLTLRPRQCTWFLGRAPRTWSGSSQRCTTPRFVATQVWRATCCWRGVTSKWRTIFFICSARRVARVTWIWLCSCTRATSTTTILYRTKLITACIRWGMCQKGTSPASIQYWTTLLKLASLKLWSYLCRPAWSSLETRRKARCTLQFRQTSWKRCKYCLTITSAVIRLGACSVQRRWWPQFAWRTSKPLKCCWLTGRPCLRALRKAACRAAAIART